MADFITVNLPKEIYAKPLRFPKGMPKEDIDRAIEKRFPQARQLREDHLLEQNPDRLRYLKDVALGAGRMGNEVLNLPNKLKELSGNRLFTHAGHIPEPTRESVGLRGTESLADKLISGLGQHALGFLAPEAELGALGRGIEAIPRVGGFAARALAKTLPVAAFEATQSANPIEGGREAAESMAPFSALSSLTEAGSPALRLAGKVGLGAGGAYLGHKLSQAIGGGLPGELLSAGGALLGTRLGVNPQREARSAVLEGVEGSPYKERLAAANRLGLSYLTPAEASGNPFTAGIQGNIGRTEPGAKRLYERGEERLGSEERAINKLLDTTFKEEELAPRTKELYENAYKQNVPEQDLYELQDNEVFKRAQRLVENRPAYKESLKNVPKNSVAYLDHVKQALDDMIEKAPIKEGRIIKDTQKSLINKLDQVSPQYGEARGLAERGILRRDLEKEFNKKDMRGTNFLKVLNDKKKFGEIQHHLRNVPEAQEQLNDMRMIFKDLINPPTVRTAAGLAKTSMTKERSSSQALLNTLTDKLTGGKFDKAAVELITNPKWAEELKRIGEVSKGEKRLTSLLDLIGRAKAASTTEKSK